MFINTNYVDKIILTYIYWTIQYLDLLNYRQEEQQTTTETKKRRLILMSVLKTSNMAFGKKFFEDTKTQTIYRIKGSISIVYTSSKNS